MCSTLINISEGKGGRGGGGLERNIEYVCVFVRVSVFAYVSLFECVCVCVGPIYIAPIGILIMWPGSEPILYTY